MQEDDEDDDEEDDDDEMEIDICTTISSEDRKMCQQRELPKNLPSTSKDYKADGATIELIDSDIDDSDLVSCIQKADKMINDIDENIEKIENEICAVDIDVIEEGEVIKIDKTKSYVNGSDLTVTTSACEKDNLTCL